MTQKTFDLIRTLDAAPASSITADDSERREALLHQILSSSTSVTPQRRRSGRVWASVGIGTMLVGAAAFGAVIVVPHLANNPASSSSVASGPLTPIQLASWTSKPASLAAGSPLADKAQSWCETNLGVANGAGGASTISNLDARGSVASMIYQRNGLLYYCLSGGDGTGAWEVVDQAPSSGSVADDSLLLDSAGSHGNGAAGLTYAVGFAGSAVKAVTFHESGLAPIDATVDGGRWTAWWPTPDASAHGGPSGTITISTTDGQTHTVAADSIYPN
ncbi:hypothetical protein [Glaciihabitans sp. dw_435]|uniref:hypothetical protein n=1 Tax=Glaciihabitans sp. dw_435 TaxID=2720081 RepID=UPI001BD39349|nr:hypothetical protein [Glaciihabitans sp. dw_435]